MARKPLLWHLLPSYLAVALVSLFGLGVFASHSLRVQFTEFRVEALEQQAKLLAPQLLPAFEAADAETAGALCRRAWREIGHRITCILPDGSVLGDSDSLGPTSENQAHLPEVAAALGGKSARDIRFDRNLGAQALYVAIPVRADNQIVGILRAALPMHAFGDALAGFHRSVGAFLLLASAFAVFVAWAVAGRVTRALEGMGKGASRYAEGDLSARLPVPEAREMAQVAETLNRMAEQLDARIQTITEQRNERNAVLASMVEAVIAVDRDGRIITLNAAAAKLFRTAIVEMQGRPLQAVVRNSALQDFVHDALGSSEPIEREIRLLAPREQVLQAHGSVLRDAAYRPFGSVIVLNDVTHLRRLESIRRDFVANVSHELKTPITSIKGFVETLQDGAWEDTDNLHRFLAIIAKQANRMNAIIEDLLTLSRIESEKENADALLRDEAILPVVESAVQLCHVTAKRKNVRIGVEVDPALRGKVNAALLEQGVLNLVDNAVKYSEVGSEVWVRAERTEDELLLRVVDAGAGISPEHLARVFERFYRVDKARSREVGGTGLGLAIVKHIAQAHGGRVTVESQLGQGSTFTLHVPAGNEAIPGPEATS